MATIKDVARLAGVGLGTASRVVSGKGSVSPATLERVRKAIEELDFRPSHAARSLLSGSNQMVGVYVPVLSGTFYLPILQLIDAELRAAGLHMVLASGVGGGDDKRQAIEGIEFLLERGCDGLIVMSSALAADDLETLGSRRDRVILLNHRIEALDAQCFTIDHTEGGRLAARTLLEYKHRKIAVIAGPVTAPDNVARMNGFLAELEEAGVNTRKLWIAESDFSPAGGWQAARELLASGYAFSALFCANDEMAIGALSHFHEVGLRVPEDLSVIGYDDIPTAAFSAPRLTSVHTSWHAVTLNGLNELLNRCYDLGRPVSREFTVDVTFRASLKPATARRRPA